jgi:hypothetical protein
MQNEKKKTKESPTPQKAQLPQDENPGGPPETKDLSNSAPGKSSKNQKPKVKADKG